MLHWGLNLTQAGDPLHPIGVEEMYNRIRHPKPAFQDAIQQLRAVRAIDEKMYRELKKRLPYFVCGTFHPAVRRRENFAATEHLLLDLDHLAEAGHEPAALAARLAALPEVELCFASPGGDGLKVLFRLDEPCRDAGQFSAFYKLFALSFAQRHQLEGVVDLATHDVSRACFVSYDPDAYYRAAPEPLSWAPLLSTVDADTTLREARRAEQTIAAARPTSEAPADREPAAEILAEIRRRMNPGARTTKPKQYEQPPQLAELTPLLAAHLEQYELRLESANPINYGRQLRVIAGPYFAEINVFFGQRGFSVVKTTKTGSNPELAELAARAIGEYLFGPPQLPAATAGLLNP